jgi:response regulator RpfG family c-di-GMP phosphodiesterase
MPGIKGNELLAVVKERFPDIRRLIVTAYADVEAVVSAVNEGGLMGYIAKPWHEDHVWSLINIAYRAYLKDKQVKDYIAQLEDTNSKLEFALRQSLLS